MRLLSSTFFWPAFTTTEMTLTSKKACPAPSGGGRSTPVPAATRGVGKKQATERVIVYHMANTLGPAECGSDACNSIKLPTATKEAKLEVGGQQVQALPAPLSLLRGRLGGPWSRRVASSPCFPIQRRPSIPITEGDSHRRQGSPHRSRPPTRSPLQRVSALCLFLSPRPQHSIPRIAFGSFFIFVCRYECVGSQAGPRRVFT